MSEMISNPPIEMPRERQTLVLDAINVSVTSRKISRDELLVQSRVFHRITTDAETVLPIDDFNFMVNWLDEPVHGLPTATLVAEAPHRIVRS